MHVSTRVLLSCSLVCLLGIVAVCSDVSSVYAASVKITKVQYPPSLTYGTLTSINIDANVAYQGLTQIQGQYGSLSVAVLNSDGSLIVGEDVAVTCSPSICIQRINGVFGTPLSSGLELNLPSDSGTEDFNFTFSSSHVPAAPFWQLEVGAYIATNDSNTHPVDGSFLNISIVGLPTSSTYTTPGSSNTLSTSTSTLYTETTAPPYTIQTIPTPVLSGVNWIRLSVAFLISSVVVVGAVVLVFLLTRRLPKVIQPKTNQERSGERR